MSTVARFIAVALIFSSCLGGWSAEAGSSDLTKAEQDKVMKQGALSGKAQACGFDWEALSFRPVMSYWRRQGKSEEQMALIAILHGAAQGFAASETKPCTDAVRRRIKGQLPFKG